MACFFRNVSLFGVKLFFLLLAFLLRFLSFIVCQPTLFSEYSELEESEETQSDNLSVQSLISALIPPKVWLLLEEGMGVRISSAKDFLGGVLFVRERLCLLTKSSLDLKNNSGFPVRQVS